MRRIILLTALLIALIHASGNPVDEYNWWPVQQAPAKVLRCKLNKQAGLAELNLAQSVSGLAAQALNERQHDEAVWIDQYNPLYTIYYNSLIKRIAAKEAGSYEVWELVKRYYKKKVIRGYILYDVSKADNSVNFATVYAGLKKGILVDVSQEKQAKAMGLPMLMNMQDQVVGDQLFKDLRASLNNHLLVLSNPAIFNNRDYAIAHKSMVYYGVDSLLLSILSWVEPLSPVIGWNKGDEFKHIEPCTRYGLINTVSDFCVNLPLLSVQSATQLGKLKVIDPRQIDWMKKGNFNSFVMSDGDNMQWTSNQFLSSNDYWANSANSQLSMGFTSCVLNLSMASRDIYEQLVKTQPDHVSVIEYGGGYYYPDLFARARANREELVKKYAQMVNHHMRLTGTKVFGMICKNAASEQAQEMYRFFAENIDTLTGMIVVQYSPYNGGDGKTFWVKNKQGISIPVVTARYQLWANQKRKGSGNPADLAGYINADNLTASDNMNWTIVHAWSRFSKDGNNSINDLKKGEKEGERGVTPVKWTSELLQNTTSIVSIEELLWRLRMKHDEVETKSVLDKM